jgi:hypothetical protein
LKPNNAEALRFTFKNHRQCGAVPGSFGGGPAFFNVSINGLNVVSNTFANFGHGASQNFLVAGSAPTAGGENQYVRLG